MKRKARLLIHRFSYWIHLNTELALFLALLIALFVLGYGSYNQHYWR